MDQEEARVLYLSRIGREKIFKYGTYNVEKARTITQDHPFYEIKEVSEKIRPDFARSDAEPAPAQAEPAPEPATEDPSELASQIISSNFKVGLSQEEVDALLNGMA